MKKITEILADTAYVRTGGSGEELRCAEYIAAQCEAMGLAASMEPFELPMYTVTEVSLTVNGRSIPCKGLYNTGSGRVMGELYYLTNTDACSMAKCRNKIVLVDALGPKRYRELVAGGALGVITYNGDVNHPHRDIDQREVRELTAEESRIPGVIINAKDAVALAEGGMAEILLSQETAAGCSHNVMVDLPGEAEEMILFSAHSDSTSLSQGAYDNMSGCIAQLYLAEYFAAMPRHYGIRFLWCGAEERGLLGSKAYCAAHDLSKLVLNINLDMLGCIMGKFTAFATCNEKAKHYLECVAAEEGFGLEAKFGIRSSDSNSFADQGVPAISFVRYAPATAAPIHNRYDTAAVMSEERLLGDIGFIAAFTRRLVGAKQFPLDREIAPSIREELDAYFRRRS